MLVLLKKKSKISFIRYNKLLDPIIKKWEGTYQIKVLNGYVFIRQEILIDFVNQLIEKNINYKFIKYL